VALVDSWINELVRDRPRAAALKLDLKSLPGLCLLLGFRLGLGLAFDLRGVFATGLPLGVLCREALRGPVGPREQLV
jgi:hypothetical protein